MAVSLLVVMAIVGGTPGADTGLGPADRAAYEAASRQAGKDSGAHVRLALWCEAHGMSAERMKHLAAAVLAEPSNILARGLLGLVAVGGRWQRPDEAGRASADDPARKAAMEQYLERRARTSEKPDDQMKLALWCEQVGLGEQASAHFHAVVRRDPKREAAWKHLGYKKVGRRWVKPEALEAERREAEERGRANKHWRPLLERWRTGLASRDRARRESSEASLAAVTDPRAVPMIWSVFATKGADDQKTAVRLFSQVDAPGASRSLAMLSVFGKSGEVRRMAIDVLRRRDPRDFVGVLVNLVRDPLKYEIRPGQSPRSPGELFVEGKRYNIVRDYEIGVDGPGTKLLDGPAPARLFDPSVPFDPFGYQNMAWAFQGMAQAARGPRGGGVVSAQALAARRDIQIGLEIRQLEQTIAVSRQQMQADIQTIEAHNADVRNVNQQTLPVLNDLTGVDLGGSGEAWQAWWTDQQGYAYASPDSSPKPTYTEIVLNPTTVPHHACFAAGTPVHTADGPRPIESIRLGDRVLSQDVHKGALTFTPVVAVFHNKPAATLKIEMADGQTFVATGIHRFWKAGKGWTMARELKAGDVLRTIGATATVASIQLDRTQPVFNLQVDAGASYFVGNTGVLAHDNSLIEPVAEPFDAVGPLSSTAGKTERLRSMLGR